MSMKIPKYKKTNWLVVSMITFMMITFSFSFTAFAEELPEGTVINAANIDELKPKTFEGKTIASMLTERLEWMVREHGLTIPIRHSEAFPVDKRWIEATKKYSGGVKFDPETKMVSGYTAGLAFPNLSDEDPDLGWKLVWNQQYSGGYPRGDLQYVPLFIFLYVDGHKGLKRTQHWAMIRSYSQGRLNGPPSIDDQVWYKNALFAHYPYDIGGLGTFNIRYSDGRIDNIYAYMRSVRRTRRLSGGSWMDPIGGTDMLNDEIEVLSAFPTWYKDFKVVGKRFVFATAHSKRPSWDTRSKQDPYPNYDTKNAPYWNPVENWEPREVYVIEATPPKEHLYSKKMMYLDAQVPVFYMAECFDKKGEFWKFQYFGLTPLKTEDGGWGILSNTGITIDFKRYHATLFGHARTSRWNEPSVSPEDVSVHMLETAGSGGWKVKREN